ncbi:large ribosomal subunit protein mL55 [Chelonoidis abingdonii]|uniref:large ribosomal subunit protein mL55 n=1 Tax=Chelonoidis abingdonii TaxID=106734 RepID=UPI0013F20902|nr:39S ribosomal protein L55, mitochondrial [Chelonoidis abingdonii]
MAAVSRTLGLLRQVAMHRLLPVACNLHTSLSQHNSNRTSIARIQRQTYGRTYPVLLVRPDGSAIHIRYKEPRRILTMPVDINTLSEAERRARLRKRDPRRFKSKQEEVLDDEFNLDDYRKFWKKK